MEFNNDSITEFLTKNGNKEFAVLPHEEFIEIQELLENLQDLREAKQEKNNSPSIPIDEVKKMLNLS